MQASMLEEIVQNPNPYPIVAETEDGREVRAAGLVGAYAERMLVLGVQTHRLPDDLDLEVASLLGCGISSALGAIENIARAALCAPRPRRTCVTMALPSVVRSRTPSVPVGGCCFFLSL